MYKVNCIKRNNFEMLDLARWFLDFGEQDVTSNKPKNKAKLKVEIPRAEPFHQQGFQEGQIKQEQSSKELADSASTLADLKAIVMKFEGCPLKKGAINTVFADGSEGAKIMLIGEAPGANEDVEGIPFCGRSGKLLNNILPSIGLTRADAYITNTVFWRPPGNRRPTASEIEICRPFVEKHIALVKPKVIVLVGSTAVESLLGSKVSMHDLRGESFQYKNDYLEQPIATTVIFHPSYLLRQPFKKKLMWFDMLKIKRLLSIQ